MTTFKSKVGYGILIPVLVLLLMITFIPIMKGAPKQQILTMLAIMLPVIAFMTHIFFFTTYQINDNKELVIKSGLFYKTIVDISKISSINKTRNLMSSPAPSIDRLEIVYGIGKTVIVSPKDKIRFVEDLKKINPNLTTKLD